MHDTNERLSLFWIFALLNYLYADVVALFAIVGSPNLADAQLVRRGSSANRKLGSLLLNYRIAQKCTQTIHAFGGHRADRERQDR